MWTKCNKFLGATTMLVALCWTVSSAAVDLREGTNYKRLQNPQPVETGDKVEVIEFFSYGCPHCALGSSPRRPLKRVKRRCPARP